MLVSMKNAVKRYDGFRLDLSLEVKEGYITGLVGQNGSGKTTAFKTILGLIGSDGGEVLTLGREPKSLTPDEKENIGVAMADTGFSAYLKLKEIAQIQRRLYKSFDADAFLKKCELSGLPLDKPMNGFSRGMKAKARLFCALSHQAKLLILDEPTSGLDVIARGEILDELRGYMEKEGRGVLISSHIATDLESLCDDIYMIDKGSVILHDDTDRLLGTYGILKATDEEYSALDKSRVMGICRESYGMACLTDDRAFYAEKYPMLTIENGSIDNIISILIRGEKL